MVGRIGTAPLAALGSNGALFNWWGRAWARAAGRQPDGICDPPQLPL